MTEIKLFTDGSVNTKSKIGYGAYLAIKDSPPSFDLLKNRVKVKRFEKTSSTKLELQTLLWALGEIGIKSSESVVIYTDSQNIIGLPGRRERFERNDYFSKNNRKLNNFELYQEFYRITDKLDFKLVKLKGHKRAKEKDYMDKLFTFVDRASRDALRKDHQ